MNSTVACESDFVPIKLATDVVIDGTAHAPGDTPVRELLASVVIGSHRKDIVVIGDRTAQFRPTGDPAFSEPVPFRTMPVRYELAYGGVDVRSDPALAYAYPRNHLGRGFVVRNSMEAVDGLELPNIEAPDDRLTPARLCSGDISRWEKQPVPDGLGWVSKYCQPRAGLAGMMPGDRELERTMRQAYARVIPPGQQADYARTGLPDMNFAWFNGASRGLVRPFLGGDETIALRNLHPDGDIVSRLPGERPRIALDLGIAAAEAKHAVIQTVAVRVDTLEFDIVWRASFPYPGLDWLPQMRRMDVAIDDT